MNASTLTKEKIARILQPHAQHLADMKARGKSLSDILYWLRNTHGWILNPAQLEKFLKQKESDTQAQAEDGTDTNADIKYADIDYSPTAAANGPSTTMATDSLAGPTMAAVGLAGLMDKFKQVLSRVMDKSDDQPATLKVIDKMMHTVITYEQGEKRLEQSERALEIKEANHGIKVSGLVSNQTKQEKIERIEASKPSPVEPSPDVLAPKESLPTTDVLCPPDTNLIPALENPPPELPMVQQNG
jgi:hypothetical protein